MTPYYSSDNLTIYCSDALDALREMPSESVHMCVTSPPYYGLRDYGTAEWEGGDGECSHLGPPRMSDKTGLSHPELKPREQILAEPSRNVPQPYRDTCRKCGAVRVDKQIGLEASPQAWVAKMVEVFGEVRRVMRKDGTLWVNVGDSYFGGRSAGRQPKDGDGVEGSRQTRTAVRKCEHCQREFTGYPTQRFCSDACGGVDNTPRFQKYGLKPKSLLMMPARLAIAMQEAGWVLRSDIIWAKCLSGGTRLYAKTQKGEMPSTLKDLVRLDPRTVQLWTGEKWSQVLSWEQTPRPDSPFEITLRSGERIGCTANHVWPTERGNVRADELVVGDVIRGCQLPERNPARQPDYLPDEIGRFIGLYIAEGSQSDGTIQIAGHVDDAELWAWLQDFAAKCDGYAARHKTGARGITININSPILLGIISTYVNGRTAKDKHLHPRCWARSDDFLRELLTGYLKGDGHWDGSRWRLGFCDNDALAADLRTIAGRLGVSVRLSRCKHTLINGTQRKAFPGWRGEMRTAHKHPAGEVVAIGRSQARKFWDVQIADEPHLFALASGVLTHNSNPMPESVTDRPTKSHEHVFMFAKSNETTFWTHPTKCGVRTRPNPDYRWTHKQTGEVISHPPDSEELWTRRNLWEGHDYYWDGEAVREKQSPATLHRFREGQAQRVSSPHRAAVFGVKEFDCPNEILPDSCRNLRDCWTIPTEPTPDAHFATYPRALVRPCVRAGTSERGVCGKCGAPWVRVVESRKIPRNELPVDDPRHRPNRYVENKYADELREGYECGMYSESTTLGWRPSCACNADIVPAVCLDPFFGSGTTGLVCLEEGRKCIGVDLSRDYCELAVKRLFAKAPLFAACGAEES